MSNITITDKQARIMGEAFAEAFWENIHKANPQRAWGRPAAFLIDRLGAAIGKEIGKAHIEHEKRIQQHAADIGALIERGKE